MDADYADLIGDANVWVLTCAERLVASLVTRVRADHLLLDSIAVAPEAQGRGHGTLLLRRADDDALDAGLTSVRLYTNAAMTENLAFYPRHGYVRTHRAEQDGFDRVFFTKELGRPPR